jgi:ElaB/YqjD/DUF883 family membrane-anchored ribosome-binding protein
MMTSSKQELAQELKDLPNLLKKREENADLKAISDKTDSLIDDNRENIDAMLESLIETAKNLNETTDDVKRYPWKLLRKP